MLCSGHGGPLGNSGVYGKPMHNGAGTRVICDARAIGQRVELKELVYDGSFARNMHVYAWLEPHPELEPYCNQADGVTSVPANALPATDPAKPMERVCAAVPNPGVFGYAVTFTEDRGQTEESVDIEIRAGNAQVQLPEQ